MKRKILIVLLALVGVVCLSLFAVACGDKDGNGGNGNDETADSPESTVQTDSGLTLSLSGDSYKVTEYSGGDTEVVIPKQYNNIPVTSIGTGAFSGCVGIRSVIIPNGITSIGESAFSGCRYLKSINLPEGVTEIGNQAFYDCKNLTSIDIPDSVISVGYQAFDGCNELLYQEQDSVLYVDNWVIGCNNYATTVITLKENTKGIADSAFGDYCSNRYACENLTSIEIPNSVTFIGRGAFSDCTSLTSINIPASVTSIGSCAFYGCTGFTSIEIPNSVTSIGSYAFSWCTNLKNITIPGSVTFIGDGVFSRCEKLSEITVDKDNKSYLCQDGVLYNIDKTKLICCLTKNTSVNIPDSVTYIGDYAFYGCGSLTSIEIPDSVTYIGKYAFYGCKSLINVTVGNGIIAIGNRAFYGCSNLKSAIFKNADGWEVVLAADGGGHELIFERRHSIILDDDERNAYYLSEAYTEYLWTTNADYVWEKYLEYLDEQR